MTQEEWSRVEKELKSFYSIVKLKCDGYEISLVLERVDQFKNAITVYINGQIKGEWMTNECEESRRFYRKVTKSLFSQKRKQLYKKIPKKMQKQIGVDIDKKYSYYMPSWTSFNSLKRNLIKNNSSIELLCE